MPNCLAIRTVVCACAAPAASTKAMEATVANRIGPAGGRCFMAMFPIFPFCQSATRRARTQCSGLTRKKRLELLAHGEADVEVETIDHRQPEAAGRHRVLARSAVLVERDLEAGNAGTAQHLLDGTGRRVTVARPLAAEQHDAVTVAPLVILEPPAPIAIEPHQRVDPPGAVEVGPLVG